MMKMWTVWIRDQTARSVQSDLDLHCPQKLLVSSSVRKELRVVWEYWRLVPLYASFLISLTLYPDDNFLDLTKFKAFADDK